MIVGSAPPQSTLSLLSPVTLLDTLRLSSVTDTLQAGALMTRDLFMPAHKSLCVNLEKLSRKAGLHLWLHLGVVFEARKQKRLHVGYHHHSA